MNTTASKPGRSTSLRNKYLPLFALVLLSFYANGQVDTLRPRTRISGTTGFSWNFVESLYGIKPGVDTPKLAVRDSLTLAARNGTFYQWSGYKWNPIARKITDSTFQIGKDTLTIRGGSGGSGSPNSNLGAAFRLAIEGTNNLRSIRGAQFIVFDTLTSGEIRARVDTTNLYTDFATKRPFTFKVDPAYFNVIGSDSLTGVPQAGSNPRAVIYIDKAPYSVTEGSDWGAAMQAAVDSLHYTYGGGDIYVPLKLVKQARVVIGSQKGINLWANIRIHGNGTIVQLDGNSSIFNADFHSDSVGTTITANTDSSMTNLTVTSSAAFSVGDTVYLRLGDAPYDAPTYGEPLVYGWFKVKAVPDGTHITLDRPCGGTMLVASTSTLNRRIIRVRNRVDNVVIEGFHFYNPNTVGVVPEGGVVLQGGVHNTVRNCFATDMGIGIAGVQFNDYFTMENCTVLSSLKLGNANFGNAFRTSESDYTTIRNCYFRGFQNAAIVFEAGNANTTLEKVTIENSLSDSVRVAIRTLGNKDIVATNTRFAGFQMNFLEPNLPYGTVTLRNSTVDPGTPVQGFEQQGLIFDGLNVGNKYYYGRKRTTQKFLITPNATTNITGPYGLVTGLSMSVDDTTGITGLRFCSRCDFTDFTPDLADSLRNDTARLLTIGDTYLLGNLIPANKLNSGNAKGGIIAANSSLIAGNYATITWDYLEQGAGPGSTVKNYLNFQSYDQPLGAGGATDLSIGTRTTTTVPVVSSTGAAASIPAATTSLAGLQSAADKYKLESKPRVFNPDLYGAVGDGVTNSTVAVAACMADLIAAGGGVMHFNAGKYIVDSIRIPAFTTRSGYLNITIQGDAYPCFFWGTVGTGGLPNRGTIIKSSNTTTGNAVIMVNPSTGPDFSNVNVFVENIEIRTYNNPSINGIDLGWAAFGGARNVFINSDTLNVQNSKPTHATTGLITPRINNGAMIELDNVTVGGGYAYGIEVNEHTDGRGINVAGCDTGLHVMSASHSSHFDRYGDYRNHVGIKAEGFHRFSIDQWAIEIPDSASQTDANNKWQLRYHDIYDPNNYLIGKAEWSTVKGNVGFWHSFIKTGGTAFYPSEIGTAAGGTVGGSNTQVLFNNSGAQAGDANLTWDNTNKWLASGPGMGLQSIAATNGWLTSNLYYDGGGFRFRGNGYGGLFQINGGDYWFRHATAAGGASGTAGAYAAAFVNPFKSQYNKIVGIGGDISLTHDDFTGATLVAYPDSVVFNRAAINTGLGTDSVLTVLNGKVRRVSPSVFSGGGSSQWTGTTDIDFSAGKVSIGGSALSAGLTISKNYTDGHGQFTLQDASFHGDTSILFHSYYGSNGVREAQLGFANYNGSRDSAFYFVNEVTGGKFRWRNSTAQLFEMTNSGLLNYATDKSGSYTSRSVVDKAYVDAAVSGGGGSNYWTSSGGNIYNNTGTNVGVGANATSPGADLDLHVNKDAQTVLKIENGNSGSSAQAVVKVVNDATYGNQMAIRSSGAATYGALVPNASYNYTASPAGYVNMVDANAPFIISTGSAAPATERFRIAGDGVLTHTSGGANIATFTSTAASNATFVLGAASTYNTNFVLKGGSANKWYWQNAGSDDAFNIFNSDANGNSLRLKVTQGGDYTLPGISSGSTQPTTSGTKHMVTVDANGLLSHETIPSGGGSASDLVVINDANYTIASNVGTVIYSVNSVSRTVTLPSASSFPNRIIHIRNGIASGSDVLLNTGVIISGTSTTTTSVPAHNTLTIQSDGTSWWVVTKSDL